MLAFNKLILINFNYQISELKYILNIFLIFISSLISAQEINNNENKEKDTSIVLVKPTKPKLGTVVQMIISDSGDTVYAYTLKPVRVLGKSYGNAEKDKLFRRYRYHVTKMYPLAKLAASKLNKYNEELSKVKKKRKQRKLLKLREKQLKEEFTETIKNMTVTQGRILTKLIDRETGNSTYDIIKEMRGGFKAFIWQGVAKLYGSDLKYKYDPKNNEEDEMIERVVLMIENGEI